MRERNIFFGLIVFIALFTLGIQDTYSYNSKEEAYKNIVNIFTNTSSIEVNFTLIDSEFNGVELKGSIKAQKGNKYRLDLGQRILISNGKDIWNYNLRDSTVMLSKYSVNDKELSFEDVFFNLIQNSTPISFYKSVKSSGKIGNYLELELNKSLQQKYKLDLIKIGFGNKDDIQKIELFTGTKCQKIWNILQMKTKVNFKSSDFNFEVPKGVELIDLR